MQKWLFDRYTNLPEFYREELADGTFNVRDCVFRLMLMAEEQRDQAQEKLEKLDAGGVGLIAIERARQIEEEGWSTDRDDGHTHGELAAAGARYALEAISEGDRSFGDDLHEDLWPWEDEWWKPNGDPVCALIKAGALIAAEIDRIQRRRKQQTP